MSAQISAKFVLKCMLWSCRNRQSEKQVWDNIWQLSTYHRHHHHHRHHMENVSWFQKLREMKLQNTSQRHKSSQTVACNYHHLNETGKAKVRCLVYILTFLIICLWFYNLFSDCRWQRR